MMQAFFGIVLLLLSCAVALLFMMFGELLNRVPALRRGYRDPSVRSLDEARVGTRPVWPAPLAGLLSDFPDPTIVVLSTSCTSCETVGAELKEQLQQGHFIGLGIVVSCPSEAAGAEYITRHGLHHAANFTDVGGDWCRGELGISTSPAAVQTRDGRISAAYVFVALEGLRHLLPEENPEVVTT